MKLAQKGIAGCGIFKVNVDAEGTTKSITLVNSVPKRVIEKPAARVIEEWEWTLAEGKSAANEEKLIRLDFCLGASSEEEANHMIITGWSKDVIKELPFEFSLEATQLLKVSLEGAVG